MSGRPAGRLAQVRGIGPVVALVAVVLLASSSWPSDAFRQLKGSEIKARFSGRGLTDGVHWSMRFGPGGRLATSEAVGRFAPEEKGGVHGTWRVVRDELRLGDGTGSPIRHQVWTPGQSVQLRRDGASPEDGVLHERKQR